MKLIISISVFICFYINLRAQGINNPYKKLAYDSVVIYDFDWRSPKVEIFSIIDENEKLASTVKKSAKVDDRTAKKLSELLGDKNSYGEQSAICFEPHLGIVYYKDSKPIAHVTICLSCNKLSSSRNIPAQNYGNIKSGMSDSFKIYLRSLEARYSFRKF
jgi:hypothetical protein